MISLQLRKRRKIILAGLVLLALPAMIYLFNSLQRNTLMYAEALDQKKRNLAKFRQKVTEKCQPGCVGSLTACLIEQLRVFIAVTH